MTSDHENLVALQKYSDKAIAPQRVVLLHDFILSAFGNASAQQPNLAILFGNAAQLISRQLDIMERKGQVRAYALPYDKLKDGPSKKALLAHIPPEDDFETAAAALKEAGFEGGGEILKQAQEAAEDALKALWENRSPTMGKMNKAYLLSDIVKAMQEVGQNTGLWRLLLGEKEGRYHQYLRESLEADQEHMARAFIDAMTGLEDYRTAFPHLPPPGDDDSGRGKRVRLPGFGGLSPKQA